MLSTSLRETWCATCCASALPSALRPEPGMSVSMIPSALAWDCALRIKVKVMLRGCVGPPQAPRSSVAASTARTVQAFRTGVRFAMAIACPVDTVRGRACDDFPTGRRVAWRLIRTP